MGREHDEPPQRAAGSRDQSPDMATPNTERSAADHHPVVGEELRQIQALLFGTVDDDLHVAAEARTVRAVRLLLSLYRASEVYQRRKAPRARTEMLWLMEQLRPLLAPPAERCSATAQEGEPP